MRESVMRAALAAALLASAAPVLAAPSALLRCDGYGRRVSSGEAVARGLVILGTLGLFGSAEADDPRARETGDKAIQACTDAMTDQRVVGNPIRRAEIFLARGIRHYEMGHFADASDDAKAALAIELPELQRAAFDRSIGVSALLLQSYIHAAEGRQDEAEALALTAAARRPWGGFITGQALSILMLSPAITAGEGKLLDRHFQVFAGSLRAQAREAARDWAGAASDYEAIIKTRTDGDELLEARRAAVLALAGDSIGADAAIKAVRQRIDEMATKAGGTDQAAQQAAQKVARADELVQLARAQLALSAGRLDDVKAVLGGRERWLAPAPIVAQVVANAQAKLGNNGIGSLSLDPAKVISDARAVRTADLSGKKYAAIMMVFWPRYEDADRFADFGKDIALPVPQVKQETERDGAVLKIGLTRAGFTDTSSEAMLVLAANVAAAQNSPDFAIVERRSSLQLPREGLSDAMQTWQIIFPTDKLWDSQKARSISVAAIKAELTPLFPAPPPPIPQR